MKKSATLGNQNNVITVENAHIKITAKRGYKMRQLDTLHTRNENLTREQKSFVKERIKNQLLLVWKGLISDHITVTNIFVMFSELPRIQQGFCLVGGGVTGIPLDMETPSDHGYHCKLLRAIKESKVSLLLFTDEELI